MKNSKAPQEMLRGAPLEEHLKVPQITFELSSWVLKSWSTMVPQRFSRGSPQEQLEGSLWNFQILDPVYYVYMYYVHIYI